MIEKMKLIKKSCYLLHRHDYHVVKVNNMIVNVKKNCTQLKLGGTVNILIFKLFLSKYIGVA